MCVSLQVATQDVQTQGQGPVLTLHQWCQYWEARRAASREPLSATAAAGASSQQRAAAAPQRPVQPAEDEADSAAVRHKRSAEEQAAAQQLKGISAELKKRVLEVAALPLTGTPLEVGRRGVVYGVQVLKWVNSRLLCGEWY